MKRRAQDLQANMENDELSVALDAEGCAAPAPRMRGRQVRGEVACVVVEAAGTFIIPL